MSDTLIRAGYWGGWLAAVAAVAYKLVINFGGVTAEQVAQLQVFPRHFWQMSVLLFLICIATDVCTRRKAA